MDNPLIVFIKLYLKREILVDKNGSVIDAVIAAGLCNGIMNSHSAGIGKIMKLKP